MLLIGNRRPCDARRNQNAGAGHPDREAFDLVAFFIAPLPSSEPRTTGDIYPETRLSMQTSVGTYSKQSLMQTT
jgi:hypothetical protein